MLELKEELVKKRNHHNKDLKFLKKTCLERYGTENVLSKGSPFYEKRNQTVKEKYGVDNIFQLEETKEKIKNAIFKRFGSDKEFYNYKSELFFKKYGVPNPWKLTSVQEKSIQTKIKKYGSINCRNIHTLSSIHKKVSDFLTSINVEHKNEDTKLIRYVDNSGKKHYSVPDIHLLGKYSNIIIEV